MFCIPSSCFLVKRDWCLWIPPWTSQNCRDFLWKRMATAVLLWRRSNILLGSQTCQAKWCFGFLIPPTPPACHVNWTEDTGGLAVFSGRFKQQLFFSDTISSALRARMFQRTEEWGWAVRKKKKKDLTSQCVLVSHSHHCSLAQCCSFITTAVRRKQPGAFAYR